MSSTLSSVFNTDGMRPGEKELFYDMYDGAAYGRYDPLQPLVDDLATPENLEAFNDWMRVQMNPRFRQVHQRIAYVEKALNELGRNVPGFARAYLRKFTSRYFYKEFKYNLKENYIYNENYDSSGTPYNWEEKWNEPVIILSTDIALPEDESTFAVFVFVDGRPVDPKYYEFHRQQTSFSVFIPYSKFIENSVYTVEVRKFWNPIRKISVTATPENIKNEVLQFSATERDLGINYSPTLDEQVDYLIFEQLGANSEPKLLAPNQYSVRYASAKKQNLLVCAVRSPKLGAVYHLVNNSACWERSYVTTEANTTDIKLEHEAGEILPCSHASEMIVDVFEPEDETGMSFRLIPSLDFVLQENSDDDEKLRSIKLVRPVPAGTKIRIVKLEPKSWISIEAYIAAVDTHGIIEVSNSILPLDVTYLDVTMNNKFIEKSRMDNILDTSFRVETFDSSHYMYYRVAFPRTIAITKLAEEYDLFKPDMERFLEHVGFNSNITINFNDFVDSEGFFIHTHMIPERVWLVTHNLGYEPAVSVTNSLTGEEIDVLDVENLDNNTIRLTFDEPTAGRVKLI